MPSPTDKKNAKVNMETFSENKPLKENQIDSAAGIVENKEPEKKVELPEWVKDEMKKNPKSAEVKELDIENTTTPKNTATPKNTKEEKTSPTELKFDSTSKKQDAVNKAAQNAVTKSENGDSFTPEEITDAKEKVDDLLKKFDDARMKALAETKPSSWTTMATIISALVTAATGGAIPFIPFGSITGDDQKMAYYNKLKATYADAMQNIDIDYKKLQANRDVESTTTDETIANAKKAAEERGSRDTAGDVYKGNAATENQKDLMSLSHEQQLALQQYQNVFQEEFSRLNHDQQLEVMNTAQNLQNMSETEQLKYINKLLDSGELSPDLAKTYAVLVSARNGITPAQVGAKTAKNWTDVVVDPVTKIGNAAGNILHGEKK